MDRETTFGLAEIAQIAIPVHDLERAEAFYKHRLNMHHLFTVSGLAFFDCSGIRLMLSVPENSEAPQTSSVLYFKVDDINAAYHTLLQRGVHFDDGPHVIANMETYDLWMAFFRDSEHNLLSIMGEVAHATIS